jgi:hypothetical protein
LDDFIPILTFDDAESRSHPEGVRRVALLNAGEKGVLMISIYNNIIYVFMDSVHLGDENSLFSKWEGRVDDASTTSEFWELA